MPPILPYIPETITVHLGAPDAPAPNVTVPFLDYVANVASSEIYPTWPENAIRANMLAQISFALNRVYTEYYRSRGYDFDITNSTAVDQSFVPGRDIFENIAELAGELFDDYLRRDDAVEPLFAQYCNGTTVTCAGLSQWGTVSLAEEGLTPYQILTRYYGNDLNIVRNAEVRGYTASLPDTLLRLGNSGNDVRLLQVRLNRVADNYPSIPKIPRADGIFSFSTETAVLAFQNIFGLTPDGVVGKATWYRLQTIYNSVKRLSELNAEGLTEAELAPSPYPLPVYGDRGVVVQNIQYYLDYLSRFYPTIPSIVADGIFGNRTRDAVAATQQTFGLPVTGTLDDATAEAIFNAYRGIIRETGGREDAFGILPYPGIVLEPGAEADAVLALQRYLNVISETFPEIPRVNETGYFGSATEGAVTAFQRLRGLSATGRVAAVTWEAITSLYRDLQSTPAAGS